MQIKGMQTEEGSSTSDEQNSKHSPSKTEHVSEPLSTDETIANNGIHENESENVDRNSNGNQCRTSPAVVVESEPANIVQNTDQSLDQPLSFELGHDMHGNVSTNNYWHGQHQEEPMFQNFQTMNPPQSIPSYGLNNNNSFPPQMHFGSIGQPSYMPGAHGQFSSPPGMHGISMMGNMGPMNGHMGNFSYQNSHSQNQRRAITAQHNYGSMGGKPMNPRFPWNNQQNSWPNGNQQHSMSPWTMALQQQKAMNRGPPMNMGPGPKSGQSTASRNPHANINLMVQQKFSKRNSPNPVMAGGATKSGYNSGSVGAPDVMGTMDSANNYQVN